MSEIPPNEPPAGAQNPVAGLPWEEPSAGIGSIVPTIVKFVARPIEAFDGMSLSADLVRPLAYFVILALVGACISQIWSYLLFDSVLGVVRELAGTQFDKLAPLFRKPGMLQLVLGLVVTPLLSLIVLFVWSALVHMFLVLFGGAHRGFAATLRVMCYAQTSQLAVVIPGVGGLVGFVWRLVLEIVGLSSAHKIEGWKAVLAVLLPLFLCCVCMGAGIALFGAAAAQALQHMK